MPPDFTSRTDAVTVSAEPTKFLTGVWALNRKILAYCAEGTLVDRSTRLKFTNTGGLAYDFSGYGSGAADTVDVGYTSDTTALGRAVLETRATTRSGLGMTNTA